MALLPELWRAATSGAEALVDNPLTRAITGQETVRLAVTGLSRAGKTVFLTSLIANLLAAGSGARTLPALEKAAGGRLRGVRVLPAGIETVPRFDHAAHLAALAADPPRWPSRTEDFSTFALTLVIERAGAFRHLSPQRTVTLELLDYPGEWLLDLPMLAQDFPEWSAATLRRLGQGPRAAAFAPFRAFLDALPPGAPADDALFRRGYTLYRDALIECRDRHGLHLLQPGRFLNPGPRGETPLLWFFPLPAGHAGSLAELCARRYDAYREDQRTGFLDPFLRRFDRQVVLADVLGALHAGPDSFADTAEALALISSSLRGTASWLDWLRLDWLGLDWLRATPPKVVFAATKADHVPTRQREALISLLRDLTGTVAPPNALPAPDGGAAHAIAAVRCTEDTVYPLPQPEGPPRPVAAVRGVLLENGRAATVYPGEVPLRRPDAEFWEHAYFRMPVFQPPRIDPAGNTGVPHLGMDTLLGALIGDLL
ncbi:YcjX family protein [Roseomonas sp. NAR14]|uniref:YcjX family protein n=1 Tax=Roseomonas acroporae TaxID=2937791 RepID=A0A9X2BYP3_9PROT|nr:YcjX family protein [Roseomonas acroporae]MCK8787139.1 YcjX family protein [Roseomonas acroporae]